MFVVCPLLNPLFALLVSTWNKLPGSVQNACLTFNYLINLWQSLGFKSLFDCLVELFMCRCSGGRFQQTHIIWSPQLQRLPGKWCIPIATPYHHLSYASWRLSPGSEAGEVIRKCLLHWPTPQRKGRHLLLISIFRKGWRESSVLKTWGWIGRGYLCMFGGVVSHFLQQRWVFYFPRQWQNSPVGLHWKTHCLI